MIYSRTLAETMAYHPCSRCSSPCNFTGMARTLLLLPQSHTALALPPRVGPCCELLKPQLHHQRRFIRLPTSDPDVLNQQVEFINMRGFPRVIGCIDGTHVHLHSVVLSSDKHVYVNRKCKLINLLLLTQNRQLRRRLSQ